MVHPDTQMPERDDEFVGKIEHLQRSITDWQLEADVHRKRAAAAVDEIERMRLTDKEWEQIKDITQYLSDHDCDDWVDTLRGVLNRLG